MVNAKASLRKMLTLGVATSMGVLAPLASLTVNAAEETITLTQESFDNAYNNKGQTYDGVTYGENGTGYEEFLLSEGNYKLGEDINCNQEEFVAVLDGMTKIDLNGHSFGDNAVLSAEGKSASFTLEGDGTVVGGLEVTEGANASVKSVDFSDYINVGPGSSLILDDSTVTNEDDACAAVLVRNSGSLTINNSDISSEYTNAVSASDVSKLTINGGTFTSKNKEAIKVEHKKNAKLSDSIINITGGTFEGTAGYYSNAGNSLNISGGDFESIVLNDYRNVVISGVNIEKATTIEASLDVKINGGDFNGGFGATKCENVSINGGNFTEGTFATLIENCNTLNVNGGHFVGGVAGMAISYVGNVSLAGGEFVSTGALSKFAQTDFDMTVYNSSMLITCANAEASKTVFTDYLADGYEYDTEFTTVFSQNSGEAGNAYSNVSKFSVVKSATDDQDDSSDDQGDSSDKQADKKDGSSDKKSDASDKKDSSSDKQEDKKDDEKKSDSTDKKADSKKADEKHSSEWVDGKWYNEDGTQTYKGTLSWKQNENGWWVEDSDGWFPQNQWQKIDGKWYFFCADGYMDYSEYRDGCWLGADGAWDESFCGGHWMQNETGWWYEDESGWYPQNQNVWIDGVNYFFGADGYCK